MVRSAVIIRNMSFVIKYSGSILSKLKGIKYSCVRRCFGRDCCDFKAHCWNKEDR